MTTERLAEVADPALLRKRILETEDSIRRDREWLAKLREALAIRTGHRALNMSDCACGHHIQGGYPSDKARAMDHHLFTADPIED